MMATSDVFSFSLMMIAFYCLAKSQENEKKYWVLLTGLVVGAAILTRTNGIAFLGFLLFYISFQRHKIHINKKIVLLLIGILTPLFIWIGYALITNSPLAPVKTYENLALTYYSDNDRTSGDARVIVSKGFSSSIDVVLKDPIRTAKIYTTDFFRTIQQISSHSSLMKFPFAQLAIPGLLFLGMMFMFRNHYYFIIFLNLLFLFLLLNLKAYEPRYHLYFLPFFGAGIAHTAKLLYDCLYNKNPYPRFLFIFITAILIFMNGAVAFNSAYSYQINHTSSDAFAASICLRSTKNSNDDIVISRKPHVGFYSDMQGHMIPNVTTIKELEKEIYTHIYNNNKNIFLFFGLSESESRKELKPILFNDSISVEWLEKVCSGDEEGGWVVYRVRDKKNYINVK